MRVAVFFCLLCHGRFATAASTPVDDYLATRNHYIAFEDAKARAFRTKYNAVLKSQGYGAAQKLCPDSACDTVGPEQDTFLNDLHDRLVPIVGPTELRGFSRKTGINLGWLDPESGYGFGKLDGLTYESFNKRTKVIVTTISLLKNWMEEQKPGPDGTNDIPVDVPTALRTESFYFTAMGIDAGYYWFGDVPAPRVPDASFSFAELAFLISDYAALYTPDKIIVTIVRANRVFIFENHIEPLKPIDHCAAIFRLAEKAPEGVQDDADRRTRRCYAENLKHQPYFKSLADEAQRVADLTGP